MHPGLEQPVAFLDGHDVVPLVRPASAAVNLGHLIALWSDLVPPSTASRTAEWLGERGILLTDSAEQAGPPVEGTSARATPLPGGP